MAAVGIEEVDIYVLRRHNTVAQYIVTHLILKLWLVAKRQLGSQVSQKWWKQDGIYLGAGKGSTA